MLVSCKYVRTVCGGRICLIVKHNTINMQYNINQKNGKLLNFNSSGFQKKTRNQKKNSLEVFGVYLEKYCGWFYTFDKIVLRTVEHNHVLDKGEIEAKTTDYKNIKKIHN